MKKLIFILLSLLSLGAIAYYIQDDISDRRLEYTTFNDSVHVNDDVYVTENTGESGYLYQIGSDYHVKNIFRVDDIAKDTWVEQVTYTDGSIYLLVLAETVEEKQAVNVINILRLDANTLTPTGCTHWMKTYIPGNISNMTVDGDYIYITELMDNNTQTGVYAISLGDFSPIEEYEDLNIRNVRTIRYSDSTKATDGYYYVYASFLYGTMTTIENGSGMPLSSIYDEKAAKIYDSKILSIKQYVYLNRNLLIKCILFYLAFELLLISVLIFFYRRNRVGYMIFLWEVMLFIVLGLGIFFLRRITYMQNLDQGTRFAEYVMDSLREEIDGIKDEFKDTDDFYNSENYRNLVYNLAKVDHSYDDGNVFLNILVVDSDNDFIIAAGESFDRCSFEKEYGSYAYATLLNTVNGGIANFCRYYLDGREVYCSFMGAVDDAHPELVIAGVFDVAEIYADNDFEDALYIIVIVLFVVMSVLGSLILLIQSFDLHRIGDSMQDVAEEKHLKKPLYLGADVGDMWSGLLDIDRSFRNVNYKKYRLYEAYYRFAPKAVATILGKDSVTEVNNGDSVKASGTVAAYRLDMKRMLRNADDDSIIRNEISDGKIRQIMELINKYQEQGLALQVSNDSDMSDMKFIMPEDNRKAIDFGVEFHKVLQRGGLVDAERTASIFMHYSDFVYGVAGTDEHAVQIMIAPEYIKLESFLDILTELRLRLVVSGVVFDREIDVPANRLIGYFDIEGSEPMPLYEIIETCPDEERRLKQECDEIFQRALKLFLEKEYYLARNNFAHILKRNPDDTVARWYVFACEKYYESGVGRMSIGLNQKIDY